MFRKLSIWFSDRRDSATAAFTALVSIASTFMERVEQLKIYEMKWKFRFIAFYPKLLSLL